MKNIYEAEESDFTIGEVTVYGSSAIVIGKELKPEEGVEIDRKKKGIIAPQLVVRLNIIFSDN